MDSRRLLFQADPFEQGGEARVASEVGPARLHGQKRQEQVARVDGLFEPAERLLLLAQTEVDEREVRRRYGTPARRGSLTG